MPENIVLDSTIFFEAWAEDRFMSQCRGCIRRYISDGRRTCFIPVIVPGEVLKNLIEKTDRDRLHSVLREYRNTFVHGNITFITIDEKVLEIVEKLGDIRVGVQDKFIIASAISSNCTVIYTLDTGIHEEKAAIARICREITNHGITIKYPEAER